MQLTCDRTIFLAALNELQTVVQSRVVQPALSCVKLEASGTELILTGTNTALTLHLTIPCLTTVAGTILVPQRQLTEWLRLITGESVIINTNNSGTCTFTVTSPGSQAKPKCTLPTMVMADFPNTDAVADALVNNTYITLPAELERALRLTAVATLDNAADPRAQLHALTFAFSKDQLNIYATDSFRLALQTLDLACTNDLTFMLLVAGVQTNLLSLLKQLQPESEIRLYDLTNQVLFQLECKNFSALLTLQKVAGTPMSVLRLIPKDTPVTLTLDRVELIAALQAAQVFGKDNHNKVYLDFYNEPSPCVTLSSAGEHNATGHVNTLELQSLVGATQFFVILNALYFLEYLKASSATTLQLSRRATERSPLICRDMDALTQGLYLMMPMVENSAV